MGKLYRFVWNHSEKGLSAPPGFAELPNDDSSKKTMLSIAQQISRKSGAYQYPGLYLVIAHYLLLILMMVIYCLVENAAKAIASGVILLVAPFLSFMPIAFAMVRASPIDRINAFLAKHEPQYMEALALQGFSMTSLFISDATITGKRFSFCERVILGRNFSGFVEFEEKSPETMGDVDSKRVSLMANENNFLDSPVNRGVHDKNIVVPKPHSFVSENGERSPLFEKAKPEPSNSTNIKNSEEISKQYESAGLSKYY